MKVAVVGAGSTYTPELIEGIARRPELEVTDLSLIDIDRDRLDVVGGLAERMLDAAGYSGGVELTASVADGVMGADFVLLQLRVGGQAARLVDETLPLRFGCIGQETTGPGGFAKALRTVPVVLDIAEQVRRSAAPGAWIVDFTNPVGIVTRALLDAGHRAVGLCNVAIGFERRLAVLLGVAAQRVRVDQVGLNHLSWIRSVYLDDVDVLDDLLARHGQEIADEIDLPLAALTTLRVIPSYYLHYFYCTDSELEHERTSTKRAEEVSAIEAELLQMYRDPNLTTKPQLLEERGGAFYSEAAAQLVSSLHSGTGDIQVVDVHNGTTIDGLPPQAVVEVPCRVDREGAHPLPQPRLAPELLGLVQANTSYEELAIEAALTGDRQTAVKALLANPLVRQWEIAEPLLEALLDANRVHLPQFFS
jgi:6-phospho-beta-glucosidase